MLGTNNSMFDRAACLRRRENFDPSLNESGGEDSLAAAATGHGREALLFRAEAQVVEWAPPRRLTWAYVKKRKFLSGQIRVFVQDMARPGDVSAIARWMAAGAAQAAAFRRRCAGSARRSARPRARKWRRRRFGGLGKIFWTRRFRLALYGRGLVS